MSSYVLTERKRTAIINALINAGWGDVLMPDWEYQGDLKINCEEYIEGKGMAGDYYNESPNAVYDDFGTNKEINKIIKKYGCYAEWYDCAVFSVCRG
jgi:hypothetical protein